MADYICPYICSYRTNSGFCGYTGGKASCVYRKLTGFDSETHRFYAEPVATRELVYSNIKNNYYRLTHMSMEELAEFEHSIAPNSCPPGHDSSKCIDKLYAHGEGPYPSDKQCMECWLNWLKQNTQMNVY